MRELHEAPLHLAVPNDPKYLRMVRLVVASAAADLEFSFDAIEDLRIVADELINLVMSVAIPGATVQIGIFPGKEFFELRGSAFMATSDGALALLGDRGAVVALDVLAEHIVASLVDNFKIETIEGRIEVAFSVRCPIGSSDG